MAFVSVSMAFCDASALSRVLTQWGSGSLDGVASRAHVVSGLDGCVLTAGGLRAETLSQRFTSEDVNRALFEMARRGLQGFVGILTCYYLLGWSVERIGRVMEHPDVSHTLSYLIAAEDAFGELLLDGPKKSAKSAREADVGESGLRSPAMGDSISQLG